MLLSGQELIKKVKSISGESGLTVIHMESGQFLGIQSGDLDSAAKKVGHNVESYAELFREIEEELGVQVIERIGDSGTSQGRMRTMMISSQPSMITVCTSCPVTAEWRR
jgi:hypothetical protein